MNKRIRKKRHLGEFREFGVEVTFRLSPEVAADPVADEAVFDDFLGVAIEGNGLMCGGGGGGGEYEVFVECGRADVAAHNRAALETWLAGHAAVIDFAVGDLVDAWAE